MSTNISAKKSGQFPDQVSDIHINQESRVSSDASGKDGSQVQSKKSGPPLLRSKSTASAKIRHSIQRHPISLSTSASVTLPSSVTRAPATATNSIEDISTPASPRKPNKEKSSETMISTEEKNKTSRAKAYSRLNSLTTPVKTVHKKLVQLQEKHQFKKPLQNVSWLVENPEHEETALTSLLHKDPEISRKREREHEHDTAPEVVVRPKKFQRIENNRIATEVALPARFTLNAMPAEDTEQDKNHNAPVNKQPPESARTSARAATLEEDSLASAIALLEKVKNEL